MLSSSASDANSGTEDATGFRALGTGEVFPRCVDVVMFVATFETAGAEAEVRRSIDLVSSAKSVFTSSLSALFIATGSLFSAATPPADPAALDTGDPSRLPRLLSLVDIRDICTPPASLDAWLPFPVPLLSLPFNSVSLLLFFNLLTASEKVLDKGVAAFDTLPVRVTVTCCGKGTSSTTAAVSNCRGASIWGPPAVAGRSPDAIGVAFDSNGLGRANGEAGSTSIAIPTPGRAGAAEDGLARAGCALLAVEPPCLPLAWPPRPIFVSLAVKVPMIGDEKGIRGDDRGSLVATLLIVLASHKHGFSRYVDNAPFSSAANVPRRILALLASLRPCWAPHAIFGD
jgi:hypothetical protein